MRMATSPSLAGVAGFLFLLSTIGATARATEPGVATKRWWSHVIALANDGMRGRDTGSPEHHRAQEYVVRQLERNGVKAAGEQGYFQTVPLRSLRMVSDRSSVALIVGGRERPLTWLRDIAIAPAMGLPASLSGALVFAGSDNAAGLRVEGAIVVRLNAPRLIGAPAAPEVSKGAIASIGIDSLLGPEPSRWPAQNALAMTFADGTLPRAQGLPAFRFNPASAEMLFEGSGHSFKEVLDLATAGKSVRGGNDLAGEIRGEQLVSLSERAGILAGNQFVIFEVSRVFSFPGRKNQFCLRKVFPNAFQNLAGDCRITPASASMDQWALDDHADVFVSWHPFHSRRSLLAKELQIGPELAHPAVAPLDHIGALELLTDDGEVELDDAH